MTLIPCPCGCTIIIVCELVLFGYFSGPAHDLLEEVYVRCRQGRQVCTAVVHEEEVHLKLAFDFGGQVAHALLISLATAFLEVTSIALLLKLG